MHSLGEAATAVFWFGILVAFLRGLSGAVLGGRRGRGRK
jgi:hypothetical protein